MNLNVLANNVRRIRTAQRLSQPVLAGKAGLSVPAIKNLENARNEPRVSTVQAIARALDVRLQDLFAPARELKTVRFRSSRRMQYRENILAEMARWLDDFVWLENALDMHLPFALAEVRRRCNRRNIVKAASLCREELGLRSTEPIHDICGLLESAGVKVLPYPMASDGFFGLSIGEEDGGPAVAVNVWERISVERRIFSAAHELGHLMLHPGAYDVSKTEESKKEEEEANLFAGHFLMPDEGFQREWKDAAGLDAVDRVFKVKRIFHVSYKTVLSRLIEQGAADKSVWARFNVAYQRRFKRKLSFKEEPMGIDPAEPYGLQPFDFCEDRFSRLVRKAIESERISTSRGAEMLRIPVEEMQERLAGWEALR